jgi:hypothetical protein
MAMIIGGTGITEIGGIITSGEGIMAMIIGGTEITEMREIITFGEGIMGKDAMCYHKHFSYMLVTTPVLAVVGHTADQDRCAFNVTGDRSVWSGEVVGVCYVYSMLHSRYTFMFYRLVELSK